MVQNKIRGAKCIVMLVCIVYIVKELRNLAQKYKQTFILVHKLIITINEGFQTKTQSKTWIIHNQTKQTYKQTFKQHKQTQKQYDHRKKQEIEKSATTYQFKKLKSQSCVTLWTPTPMQKGRGRQSKNTSLK